MRKQVNHTPREMSGGAGKEEANRLHPAEDIYREKEREKNKKYNQRKEEKQYG